MADWLDRSGVGVLHKILADRQALETGDLTNQNKQLVNDRYAQETPYQLNSLFQKNEETRLKNQITNRTMESGIGATNAENETKTLAEKTKTSIQRNNLLIEAYSSGGKPELIRKAKELGASQEFFDKVINSANPGNALTQNRIDLMSRLAISPESMAKEEQDIRANALERQRMLDQHKLDMQKQAGSGEIQKDVAEIYGKQRIDAATAAAANKPVRPPKPDELYGAWVEDQIRLGNIPIEQKGEWLAKYKAAGIQQSSSITPEGELTTKGASSNILPNLGGKPKRDIKSIVEASGVPYEPDKYHYRLTPEGVPQRKKK